MVKQHRVKCHSRALEAVILSQNPLVLFMSAELDGSVWNNTHHRGRVPPPQTEEAILQIRAVN